MQANLKEILINSSLFHDVQPELMDTILARSITRSIEENAYFFMEGDPATHAYILVTGQVKMLQVTADGHQIALRIMTPGQTFGGIAMLRPQKGYPASALAMEDSSALAWSTDTLRELADMDIKISLNTMQIMYGYIRELQERQVALIGDRVEQRVARVILKLAAQSGTPVQDGVLIDIPLTRQDIAEMTGTTLYSVSRTLNDWERQGLVRLGRGRVIVIAPHRLVLIADEIAGNNEQIL